MVRNNNNNDTRLRFLNKLITTYIYVSSFYRLIGALGSASSECNERTRVYGRPISIHQQVDPSDPECWSWLNGLIHLCHPSRRSEARQ